MIRMGSSKLLTPLVTQIADKVSASPLLLLGHFSPHSSSGKLLGQARVQLLLPLASGATRGVPTYSSPGVHSLCKSELLHQPNAIPEICGLFIF